MSVRYTVTYKYKNYPNAPDLTKKSMDLAVLTKWYMCIIYPIPVMMLPTFVGLDFLGTLLYLPGIVITAIVLPIVRKKKQRKLDEEYARRMGSVQEYAARSGAAAAVLTVQGGPRDGSGFRCQEGQTVILGRDPSKCNLALPEYNTISRQHCCMEVCPDFLMVMDMNSANGTFVNGTRLEPYQSMAVRSGDRLWIGNRDCEIRVTFE